MWKHRNFIDTNKIHAHMPKHNKFIISTPKFQDYLNTKTTFQFYETMQNIIWAH